MYINRKRTLRIIEGVRVMYLIDALKLTVEV